MTDSDPHTTYAGTIAAGAGSGTSTGSIVVTVRRLISKNKAIAAGVTTLAGAVGSALVSVIVTGNLDPAELRVAAGGLVLAVVTYASTYLTSAGEAEVDL